MPFFFGNERLVPLTIDPYESTIGARRVGNQMNERSIAAEVKGRRSLAWDAHLLSGGDGVASQVELLGIERHHEKRTHASRTSSKQDVARRKIAGTNALGEHLALTGIERVHRDLR